MSGDWIPVEERLPQKAGQEVLVVAVWHDEERTRQWVRVTIGWYRRGQWVTHVGITVTDRYPVTHWMPLPEPPPPVSEESRLPAPC